MTTTPNSEPGFDKFDPLDNPNGFGTGVGSPDSDEVHGSDPTVSDATKDYIAAVEQAEHVLQDKSQVRIEVPAIEAPPLPRMSRPSWAESPLDSERLQELDRKLGESRRQHETGSEPS